MADLLKDLRSAGGTDPADGFFIGVDMGAKPSGTAVAGVAWPSAAEKPALVFLRSGCAHEEIGEFLAGGEYSVAAVDVPFGWPRPFVQMVGAQADGPLHGEGFFPTDPAVWRTQTMALRQTDICVKNCLGIRPISASFDKLGSVAAAWALVEAQIHAHRSDGFDRTGGLSLEKPLCQRIIETYPAAQVVAWERAHHASKDEAAAAQRLTRADRKQKVVRQLVGKIGLDLGEHFRVLDQPSHSLDATICALTAALITRRPSEERYMLPADCNPDIAGSEGVIWLHDPNRSTVAETCCE